MHLMSAWTFSTVSSATEAAQLILERSNLSSTLQVYRMPAMDSVFKNDGADSQDIADLITAIDEQCTKVFPLPYERYGKLRDELMNARDRIQEELIQIGLDLLRDSMPIKEVAPSQVT